MAIDVSGYVGPAEGDWFNPVSPRSSPPSGQGGKGGALPLFKWWKLFQKANRNAAVPSGGVESLPIGSGMPPSLGGSAGSYGVESLPIGAGLPAGVGNAGVGGAAAAAGGMSWPELFSIASRIATATAGNRAAARQAESDLALRRDQTRTSNYGVAQRATTDAAALQERGRLDRANLDLNRREFALKAPGERLNTGIRGDLLANVQDVVPQVPDRLKGSLVNFTGGIRPSALSPTGRQLGAATARDALIKQLQGDQFSDVPMQDFSSSLVTPPAEVQLPQAGWLDTVLNAAGYLGAGAGAINAARGNGVQADGSLGPVGQVPLTPEEQAAMQKPSFAWQQALAPRKVGQR